MNDSEKTKEQLIQELYGLRQQVAELQASDTERRHAAAELLKSEGRLRAILENIQTAARVSHAASSILNLDELLPQVVELVRERFSLYYAGLFLVDETGRWAVLRAGTGRAGTKMLEAGHKLEIGGTSMIGACITTVKARIALDVGAEAVRFENPLLPLTRSEMALPLFSRGRVVGAVTIQSDQPAAFTQEDITILQTMADQVANAIENARLFEQARIHGVEMAALNELSQGLTARLDVAGVLEEAYRGAARLLDTTNFAIALYDEDRDEIRFPLEVTEGQRVVYDMALSSSQGMSGYIVRSREPVLVKESADKWRAERGIEAIGPRLGAQSWLGVPMIIGGRVLGVLTVQSYTAPRAFDEHDRDLLMTIASQVAVAVENARLFEQTRAHAQELAALNEMSRALSAVLNMDTAIESIYHYASRLMDTTNFYVALYDSQQDEVSFPLYAEGQLVRPLAGRRRTGQGMTEYVIRTREPLLVSENVSARVKELGIELIGQESQSWLGVPMMIGERVIGVLAAQSYTTPRLYNDHHRDLLSAVASQAAIAIENARLFEQAHARAEELAALNELSQVLASRLSVNQVLDEVYRGVSRLLDTTNYYISLYDPERNEVSFPINVSESVIDRDITVMPADRGLTGYIIRNRASVLIKEDVAGWLASRGMQHVGEPAQCWLGVPMMIGDQILGVMAIQSFTTSRAYDEHDRDMLAAIASQAVIAIQNARLFEQTRARARRELILREILSTVSASQNLAASLREIEQHLHKLVPLDTLAMTLYTPGEPDYAIFAFRSEEGAQPGQFVPQSARMPVRGTSSGWVITQGKPRLDADLGQEKLFIDDAALVSLGMASRLVLPLKLGEQVVGTLNLASAQPGIYTDEHVSILLPVTEQMALALERARLLEETRAALAEAEATQRRYLHDKWETYLATVTETPTGYMDGPNGLTPVDPVLSPEPVPDGAVLSVPLKLRGEPIGVLEFYSEDASRGWSEEERDFVEALADQAALALENARLLDETQSRAQREQLINEITARIRASMDMETILHTTTQELSKALNLSVARIHLSAGDGTEK